MKDLGEEMLNIGKAAKRLGISISTLRNWDRQGKFKALRNPLNSYRMYAAQSLDKLKAEMSEALVKPSERGLQRAEDRFNIEFVSPIALAEKQIQQSYRPYIQVHKWFARRPGSLFRALLISEFGDETPLEVGFYQSHDLRGRTVFDPFMGGGTPLFEANRLGMNVIGCDINPLAVWIVQQGLADLNLDLFRLRSQEIVAKCEGSFGKRYKTTCTVCGQLADVKYFLWIKRLDCGGCGDEVELFPGYLIAENARHPNYVFFCPLCRSLFELPTKPDRDSRIMCSSCRGVFKNSVVARRNKYTCQRCGHNGRYPAEMALNGAPRHNMIAIEYFCERCKPAHKGRFFKAAGLEDFNAYEEASDSYLAVETAERVVPDECIPIGDETKRLFRWGYRKFAELFNYRQLLGLSEVFRAVQEVPELEVRHALATVFSDFLRYQNMLCRYDTYALKCQDIFAVHGFPVGLFQCENNILGISEVGAGGFRHFVEKFLAAKRYNERPYETIGTGSRKKRIPVKGEHIAARFVNRAPTSAEDRAAYLVSSSSDEIELPPESVDAIVTDPPYFDNVQYAELMDFCYIWLRRLVKDDVETMVQPSTRHKKELTGNKTAKRELRHFCEGLSRAFQKATAALRNGGLFAFTYHHNDIEAYLPLVVSFLDAGLSPTASIPCPAEMSASIHIAGTGSSVIDTILCARKRDATNTGTQDVLRRMPDTLAGQALKLRKSGISPTEGDLRCMALGLLTIHCASEMKASWNRELPVEQRLDIAGEHFRSIIAAYPDGLSGLVRDSLRGHTISRDVQKVPEQQSLF